MLSVQRLKEISSTLRFRLMLWNTVAVCVMVVGTNLPILGLEEQTLRSSYDELLTETQDEIDQAFHRHELDDRNQLFAFLRERVKANEHRSLFVQLYDGNNQLLWTSSNAPIALPAPEVDAESTGPYDAKKHRVLERVLKHESGETYRIRCGFLQITLADDIALLNRNIFLASMGTLLVAPLGAYLIALRATQPIARIITAASHMQPSNMSERLPIRGTGDELDRLSETINGLLDRLASFINQNRDFVANAAHELRSPLAAIRTSVEVGLNHSRTPEEYMAILADVMEEITRLAGLVNRLLILAEADAGRLAGKEQVTRLNKIVRESVEMFEAVAELSGVTITLEETVAPAPVPGDETSLRQIVRNLIDNAIKYNKTPGKVAIRLRIEPAVKQVVLSIQDTGVGIDRALLPRIFERFYRADKSRARGPQRAGSGLGLSICETLIHALKGTITVESEAGVGSTFTIRLPWIEDLSLLQSSEKQPVALPAGT